MADRSPRTLIPGLCRSAVIVFVVMAAAPSAGAETMYVTDQLRLRLHAEPRDNAPAVANLSSGDAVEVLDRGTFFLLVRTPDGQEGWAKSAFLVSAKPARLRVLELEESLAQAEAVAEPLAAERDRLREAAASDAKRAQLAESKAVDLEARMGALNNEYETLLAKTGVDRLRLDWYWTAIALLLGLAAGGFLGFRWLDYLSRKRHGGYRVY